MNLTLILQKLILRQDLTADEMTAVMEYLMSGQATAAATAALLVGLRMKGETIIELTAAAKVMRQLALKVNLPNEHLVDIVGTGGDQAHTFNVSTASAFVVAAAGGKVAKHGNKAVSSRCGSADVLEAAGVKLHLTAAQVAECVKQIGIGFMFAPNHHRAMQHVSATRRELGIRTFFNLLGPLTNPAGAKYQVMGVFAKCWLQPCAEVLRQLGSKHALLVNADDGLDEISINSATQVVELKDNNMQHYQITPESYGLSRAPLQAIQAATVEQSLELLQNALNNVPGAARDSVALNAGAAIYVAGLTTSLAEGIQRALQVIANGAAAKKLQQLIHFTRHCA